MVQNPAADGAVLQLAADGGIKAGDGADVLDGRIGSICDCRAICDYRARFHELLPHVGAGFGALETQARDEVRGVGVQ